MGVECIVERERTVWIFECACDMKVGRVRCFGERLESGRFLDPLDRCAPSPDLFSPIANSSTFVFKHLHYQRLSGEGSRDTLLWCNLSRVSPMPCLPNPPPSRLHPLLDHPTIPPN